MRVSIRSNDTSECIHIRRSNIEVLSDNKISVRGIQEETDSVILETFSNVYLTNVDSNTRDISFSALRMFPSGIGKMPESVTIKIQ